MPKILVSTILVVLLISSALESSAQCYTKEVLHGKNILKGTPDYIYVRADSTYLGMTFTLIKNENNLHQLEIRSDATNDFAEPDSTVFEMENKSLLTFNLKPGVTAIGDGSLKSTTIRVNISQSDLQRVQGRKIIKVSAYRRGSKIELPVYDELFFIQQFQCLNDVSKAGK